MKVEVAPSFFKSFNKMIFQGTWYYKLWEFFRYDIGRFFGNIWKFRKELFNYHEWDWIYQMSLLRRGLELETKHLETYSNEFEGSLNKKINKMKRAVEIMKWHEEDRFIELAEKELGYEYKLGDWRFDEVDTDDLSQEITNGEKYYELVIDNTDEDKINNDNITQLSLKIERESWIELMDILKGQNVEDLPKDCNWDDFFNGNGLKGWWS